MDKRYEHVETGSVDTREGWISSYDPEELEERGLSAEAAFGEDEGRTLIETDKPTDDERRSEAAKALRAIPSKKRSETSRTNGAKGGRPVTIFDDGEFSVALSGHSARTIVLGKETGRWNLADSEIARIKAAKDSDEVVAILEE